MRLLQRNNPLALHQVLPPVEETIETGYMGDCVSVIVFGTPNIVGRYAQVAGYHGGGGLRNINFAALLTHVPNHATTLVVMVSGVNHVSQFAREFNVEKMKGERNMWRPAARLMCYHGVGNATFNRMSHRVD